MRKTHGADDGTKAAPLLIVGACPKATGDPDTGETNYLHWLNTLEKLVAADKGVTTEDTLHRYRDAWDHASDRTPHGVPIESRDDDFR